MPLEFCAIASTNGELLAQAVWCEPFVVTALHAVDVACPARVTLVSERGDARHHVLESIRASDAGCDVIVFGPPTPRLPLSALRFGALDSAGANVEVRCIQRRPGREPPYRSRVYRSAIVDVSRIQRHQYSSSAGREYAPGSVFAYFLQHALPPGCSGAAVCTAGSAVPLAFIHGNAEANLGHSVALIPQREGELARFFGGSRALEGHG